LSRDIAEISAFSFQLPAFEAMKSASSVEFGKSLGIKFYVLSFDELVKSRKAVIPAKAGIHNIPKSLDSRLRGNDKNGPTLTFYETISFRLN